MPAEPLPDQHRNKQITGGGLSQEQKHFTYTGEPGYGHQDSVILQVPVYSPHSLLASAIFTLTQSARVCISICMSNPVTQKL